MNLRGLSSRCLIDLSVPARILVRDLSGTAPSGEEEQRSHQHREPPGADPSRLRKREGRNEGRASVSHGSRVCVWSDSSNGRPGAERLSPRNRTIYNATSASTNWTPVRRNRSRPVSPKTAPRPRGSPPTGTTRCNRSPRRLRSPEPPRPRQQARHTRAQSQPRPPPFPRAW